MLSSLRTDDVSFGAKIAKIPVIKGLNVREVKLSDADLRGQGFTAFIGADVYTPSNKIAKHDLLFKDKKLVAVDDFDENTVNSTINYVILDDNTIAPAILDEHIHGGYGINFHNSSEQDIRGLLRKLKSEGTAGVVATTLPGPLEHLRAQIQVLNNIIKHPEPDGAKMYGIHLEGPFLSKSKSGIHPSSILLNPTIENYKSMNPENVRIVTFAPENKGGHELARYLQEHGVIPSAGHTMAMESDITETGIRQVTHIFNAMSPFHHRNLTVTNEALWNDAVSVEMNADQSLLHPKTMDIIMRLKPKSKVLLISDALPEAGIKEPFTMNGIKIYVKDDWTAISDTGVLAGSMQFLHNLAKKLIASTQMTFRDFIQYASVNPSRNLHVEKDFRLKEGLTPNFTVWDNKTITPQKTFIS